MEERDKCSDCLNINVKGKEQRILLSKVIYFESEKRKVIAHMLTDEISFYAKLDEVEELVDGKGFMRCHQSYMVKRNMIDSIGRTEIVAQGFSIPMSRKYYENIEEVGYGKYKLACIETELKESEIILNSTETIIIGRDNLEM